MRIIWEILNTNFVSSVVGGLLVAVIFWKLIAKRVEKLLEFSKNKKLSNSVLVELLYNRIVAEKVTNKEVEYINGEGFPFLPYETENIKNFLITEPLSLSKEFYINLRVVVLALQKDNKLMNIYWFSPSSSARARLKYKMIFVSNAKININSIDKLIADENFQSEMRKLGLTDT